MSNRLILSGALRLSEPGGQRKTAGQFSKLINENASVFLRYFRTALFPGSLNVDVPEPQDLQQQLDNGRPRPSFVIPRAELVGMPDYIGDGQAWACVLECSKIPEPFACWVFRRIGSRVPYGVIEVVAPEPLVPTYGLNDGDPVMLHIGTTGEERKI